ncbi:hypothetical protein GCM10010350_45690 [Streptomyces galilaeus]|nr:hypothetical protein GCM10010350_45690 [Streptomyces galilaeus]
MHTGRPDGDTDLARRRAGVLDLLPGEVLGRAEDVQAYGVHGVPQGRSREWREWREWRQWCAVCVCGVVAWCCLPGHSATSSMLEVKAVPAEGEGDGRQGAGEGDLRQHAR